MFYTFSWKSLKSGNTVNTEYLNRIPNPECLTGANVPFVFSVAKVWFVSCMFTAGGASQNSFSNYKKSENVDKDTPV